MNKKNITGEIWFLVWANVYIKYIFLGCVYHVLPEGDGLSNIKKKKKKKARV